MINRSTIESLQSILKDLNLKGSYNQGTTRPYSYKNLNAYREAINTIEILNLFPQAVSEIKKTEIFTKSYLGDDDRFESDESKKIDKQAEIIFYKAQGLIEATTDLIKNTSSALIFEYRSLKDLSQLERFAKDLKQSIEIPLQVLVEKENNLEILLIEEGSIVLTISFGAGIIMITKIIDLAFKYKMKWEEAKRSEVYTKSLSLDVGLQETVTNAIQQQVKNYLQTESELLINENIENPDNQKVETIKNSINVLNDLLNKGLSIKASLNAPYEIKQKFEEFKSLESKEQIQLPLSVNINE